MIFNGLFVAGKTMGIKMSLKLTKEDCISLLKAKYEVLKRLPKKSDFQPEEAAMIKSYLGPWPRALEAAGVKEQNPQRLLKKQEKRQRQKANRIRYKKEHPKENKNEKENCIINIDSDIID